MWRNVVCPSLLPLFFFAQHDAMRTCRSTLDNSQFLVFAIQHVRECDFSSFHSSTIRDGISAECRDVNMLEGRTTFEYRVSVSVSDSLEWQVVFVVVVFVFVVVCLDCCRPMDNPKAATATTSLIQSALPGVVVQENRLPTTTTMTTTEVLPFQCAVD